MIKYILMQDKVRFLPSISLKKSKSLLLSVIQNYKLLNINKKEKKIIVYNNVFLRCMMKLMLEKVNHLMLLYLIKHAEEIIIWVG